MTTLTQPLISKQCNHCLGTKSVTEFYKNKANRDGLQKRCIPCQRKATAASKAKVGSEVTQQRQHETQLRRKYGISVEQYKEMFTAQQGQCAICGTTDPGHTRTNFCVDHCHSSGKVRGLLCNSCNTAIGKFNVDIERIHKAIAYLEATQPSNT